MTIQTSHTYNPITMPLAVDAMAELDQISKVHRRPHDEDAMTADVDLANSDSILNGPSKRRKRNRKSGMDRKYECNYEGCGKSYSRAEHLYRHQLNHTPKQIYQCDFPDCFRSFVRQDLCARHRERHTIKGSQLQRRDHYTIGPIHRIDDPAVTSDAVAWDDKAQVNGHGRSTIPASRSSDINSPRRTITHTPSSLPSVTENNKDTTGTHAMDPGTRPSTVMSPPLLPSPMGAYSYQHVVSSPHNADNADSNTTRSTSSSNHTVGISPLAHSNTTYSSSDPQGPYGKASSHRSGNPSISSSETGLDSSRAHPPLTEPDHSSIVSVRNDSSVSYPMSTGMDGSSMISPTTYASQNNLQMPSLPINEYQEFPLSGTAATTAGLGGLDSVPAVMASGTAVADSAFDSASSYAYPLFGSETYSRSPFAMADDFAAWLFNEPLPGSSSLGVFPPAHGMMTTGYMDPFFANDPGYSNYLENMIPLQHPMSVTSIVDPGSPQAVMSEEKRQDLLLLISTRFNEAAYSAVAKRKDAFMDGDIDDDNHVLSLHMMQAYIGSYWYHFHGQLPMLHKPTFSADKTPNLLLLAVMAIGASTLDDFYGHETTETAAELANFISWHLRWEIFMDADFRPPAKLWIFQALLLLEVHEKMYATRALHERAHIHHDTTLTLMRRGSSLIDRSAFESPASLKDDRRSTTYSTSMSDSAPEESWTQWVKAESTRRVAFAAFVLDSTHATMFGHSAKMVAHELRLPLPCDEALWSATSAAEVARIQASLHANGVKPTMFLDGLKKTLNGRRVRTNTFGRTILMAGLLSVSWHMNQRDLQVSSLGVTQALGGRDKWRSSLLRAFDNWRRDFEEALTQGVPYSSQYAPRRTADEDNVIESRDALHRLVHMALHVDIMDCQVFAGARRLLGRSIAPKDYKAAREKMMEWATKASARDAVFYALKFLSECLLNKDDSSNNNDNSARESEYSARGDYLFNRPWVLYFAALVVWCYGYALEGPIATPTTTASTLPTLSTRAEQRQDMHEFLRRVGGVREPNELELISGRNRCMGLLMVLRENFMGTRWELLSEAGGLLGNCMEKLRSGVGIERVEPN